MQSEIDEIRECLRVLRILNEAGELDQASCRAGLAAIGKELDLVEAQQGARLAGSQMVALPVMTLAQVAAAASRGMRARLTLVEGGPVMSGPSIRTCRVCGCTDARACVDPINGPCWWVESDLCSACSLYGGPASSRGHGPDEDGDPDIDFSREAFELGWESAS